MTTPQDEAARMVEEALGTQEPVVAGQLPGIIIGKIIPAIAAALAARDAEIARLTILLHGKGDLVSVPRESLLHDYKTLAWHKAQIATLTAEIARLKEAMQMGGGGGAMSHIRPEEGSTHQRIVFEGLIGKCVPLELLVEYSTNPTYIGLQNANHRSPTLFGHSVYRRVRITFEELDPCEQPAAS